jgi:hypothetical protein
VVGLPVERHEIGFEIGADNAKGVPPSRQRVGSMEDLSARLRDEDHVGVQMIAQVSAR